MSDLRLAHQPHSWEILCLNLQVLPVLALVFFGYSGFLPHAKNMHVKLSEGSNLSIGVKGSVNSCLSICGSWLGWEPVYGTPHFSTRVSCARLRLTCNLNKDKYCRKRMGDFFFSAKFNEPFFSSNINVALTVHPTLHLIYPFQWGPFGVSGSRSRHGVFWQLFSLPKQFRVV